MQDIRLLSVLLIASIVSANLSANELFDIGYQVSAPSWFLPSGTCMPSAAEDGQGHQTNGVNTDNCNIGKLASGCPPQPAWTGPNTYYHQIPGEPFTDIPTYYSAKMCTDGTFRVLYYIYFKKDTGHMSDWEGAMVSWYSPDGGATYARGSVTMEQDGNHVTIPWDEVSTDSGNPAVFDGDHPKFYVGKFHHSIHQDTYTKAFKNTCPPTSGTDYRNDDYYFDSWWNLRNAADPTILDPAWNWGKAGSPANIDPCSF